jgi:hypothetical protein
VTLDIREIARATAWSLALPGAIVVLVGLECAIGNASLESIEIEALRGAIVLVAMSALAVVTIERALGERPLVARVAAAWGAGVAIIAAWTVAVAWLDGFRLSVHGGIYAWTDAGKTLRGARLAQGVLVALAWSGAIALIVAARDLFRVAGPAWLRAIFFAGVGTLTTTPLSLEVAVAVAMSLGFGLAIGDARAKRKIRATTPRERRAAVVVAAVLAGAPFGFVAAKDSTDADTRPNAYIIDRLLLLGEVEARRESGDYGGYRFTVIDNSGGPSVKILARPMGSVRGPSYVLAGPGNVFLLPRDAPDDPPITQQLSKITDVEAQRQKDWARRLDFPWSLLGDTLRRP